MTEFPIAWIVALSVTLDGVAGLVILLFRKSPAEGSNDPIVGMRRLVIALAATFLFFATKAVFLTGLGLNTFGLIHLIYADAVVVVPVVGLVLLLTHQVTKRRRVSRPVRALASLSLGLPLIGIYATYIEPFRLRDETATVVVNRARAGDRTFTIAVLTDLQTRHVTDYERGAIARLMAHHPDLILIPGDLFQAPDEVFEPERPALRILLSQLEAPGGVYLVPGDVDQGFGRVAQLVEGTKIVPLVNDIVRVDLGDRRLTIGGVELQYASRAALGMVKRLESAPGDDDLRILLAHRPDAVFDLSPDSRVDLVVAGHTHGGQIVVPGIGPLMTLSQVPRAVAAGGLHSISGNSIYVSRGVGCERGQAPRIRFFCPPELSLLTIAEPEAGR